MNKHKNYYDFIFFSPPYFKLELYPGKLQSTSLYPDYKQWLTEYWENTIKLCFTILKKNVLCINDFFFLFFREWFTTGGGKNIWVRSLLLTTMIVYE